MKDLKRTCEMESLHQDGNWQMMLLPEMLLCQISEKDPVKSISRSAKPSDLHYYENRWRKRQQSCEAVFDCLKKKSQSLLKTGRFCVWPKRD